MVDAHYASRANNVVLEGRSASRLDVVISWVVNPVVTVQVIDHVVNTPERQSGGGYDCFVPLVHQQVVRRRRHGSKTPFTVMHRNATLPVPSSANGYSRSHSKNNLWTCCPFYGLGGK